MSIEHKTGFNSWPFRATEYENEDGLLEGVHKEEYHGASSYSEELSKEEEERRRDQLKQFVRQRKKKLIEQGHVLVRISTHRSEYAWGGMVGMFGYVHKEASDAAKEMQRLRNENYRLEIAARRFTNSGAVDRMEDRLRAIREQIRKEMSFVESVEERRLLRAEARALRAKTIVDHSVPQTEVCSVCGALPGDNGLDWKYRACSKKCIYKARSMPPIPNKTDGVGAVETQIGRFCHAVHSKNIRS